MSSSLKLANLTYQLQTSIHDPKAPFIRVRVYDTEPKAAYHAELKRLACLQAVPLDFELTSEELLIQPANMADKHNLWTLGNTANPYEEWLYFSSIDKGPLGANTASCKDLVNIISRYCNGLYPEWGNIFPFDPNQGQLFCLGTLDDDGFRFPLKYVTPTHNKEHH